MLGTKRPSITSTWTQSAPPRSTLASSAPSCAKSAERIDGAMRDGAAHASALDARGEEAVGVVAVRQRAQEAALVRAARAAPAGAAVGRGQGEAAKTRAGTPRPRPRSPPAAACRYCRRATPPGRSAAAALRSIARCVSASRAGSPGRTRQRASGLRRSAPSPEHGRVDEDAVEAARASEARAAAGAPRRPRGTTRLSSRSRRAARRTSSRRRSWRSSASTEPSGPTRSAIAVALPPGAAQASSTRSPGLRVEQVHHELARLVLHGEAALAEGRDRASGCRAGRARCRAARSGRRAPPGSAAGARRAARRGSRLCGFARTQSGGISLQAAASAAASSAPKLSIQRAAIHCGSESACIRWPSGSSCEGGQRDAARARARAGAAPRSRARWSARRRARARSAPTRPPPPRPARASVNRIW